MNKLDFIQIGKKAVQTYLYEKYGVEVDIKFIAPTLYIDNGGAQKGRYVISASAYLPVENEVLLSSEFLVTNDILDRVYKVDEVRSYSRKCFGPDYILAISDTVINSIRSKKKK